MIDRSLIGRRAKRKGNSNELRFAKYLQKEFEKAGFDYLVSRSPRSGGFHLLSPSDIMFKKIPSESIFNDFHWENKNTKQWDIYGWYLEATRKENEVGTFKKPLIIARKPNKELEFGILNIKDLVKILIELELLRNENIIH